MIDYDPEMNVVPWLLFAFAFLFLERPWGYATSIFLMLLVREEMFSVVLFLALLARIYRRPRFYVWYPVVASLIYLVLIFIFFFPWIR